MALGGTADAAAEALDTARLLPLGCADSDACVCATVTTLSDLAVPPAFGVAAEVHGPSSCQSPAAPKQKTAFDTRQRTLDVHESQADHEPPGVSDSDHHLAVHR